MAHVTTTTARILAYRWYRSTNLQAPPDEAWDYARNHWHEFVTSPTIAAAPSDTDIFGPPGADDDVKYFALDYGDLAEK